MKKKKLISAVLAFALIFSMSTIAFATESTSLEENISFLNEHKDMIDFYYTLRLEKMTDRLNAPDITPEEKQQLTQDIASLRNAIENCIRGEHSYLIDMLDTVGPPDCTDLGICEYCGHSEIVLTGDGYRERHKDKDKDNICDDCKREMPHLNCNHFCHSENILIQNIVLPLCRIIWILIRTEDYCRCGTYHFM